MSKKVIYILGPFDCESSLNDYADVDAMLSRLGYETISPVLIPGGMDKDKAHRLAVSMIYSADAVVVLPNWRASSCAVAEHYIAYCFDKPMVDVELDGPPEVVETCLGRFLETLTEEVSA